MLKGLKNIMGFQTFDDDDFYEDEEFYDDDESYTSGGINKVSRKRDNSLNNVRKIHQDNRDDPKISIMRPKNFNDSIGICDEMKDNRIMIINTTDLEAKEAQRLLDFICGASYNMNGDVQEIEKGVYVLSPPSVEVTKDKELVTKTSLFTFLD